MNKMMITMGAVALATLATTAQELPAPAALPSPDVQARRDAFSAEDLAPGAECRVFLGGVDDYSAWGTRGKAYEQNIQRINDLFRGNEKGIVSKYDDSVEFSAIKIGGGVHWNVATWKGFLKSPVDATVTFFSTSIGPYVIRINGTEWKGSGQCTVNVPIKKGLNEVKIGKVSIDPERTVLRIKYRTTEFGQYMEFTPHNLYHEVNEDKGFSFGSL